MSEITPAGNAACESEGVAGASEALACESEAGIGVGAVGTITGEFGVGAAD